MAGGAAALAKAGEANSNAANARKASNLTRRGDVGRAAAGADGAAAASTSGVRGSLVDRRRRSTAVRASGPSSRIGQRASPQGALKAFVVAAAPPAGGKRALTGAAAAAAAFAVPGPDVSGVAAAEATAPVVATRGSKRGLRAAELAAAGLEVAKPSPAATRKRTADTVTGAASSLPHKRSRRLADRLSSTADDSKGPSTIMLSSTESAFEAVPNSMTCTLLSELSVPVAYGRRVKDMHFFSAGELTGTWSPSQSRLCWTRTPTRTAPGTLSLVLERRRYV